MSQASAATHLRARASAYARLAKLDFFDFYLSVLVVWTLLAPGERLAARSLLTLLIFLLAEVSVVAAVVAFDDVTGFRDGSDLVNYGPLGGPRKRKRKPLLDGSLTPDQAVRFGRIVGLLGALLCVLVVLVAQHRPLWAVLLIAVVFALSLQYSWGLKLSYLGAGEIVIMGSAAFTVAVPYGLVTGHAPAFVVVQSVLFGLWQLLVSAYSNTNDVAGDRHVGRRNVATTSSARGNRTFIAGLTAVEFLLVAGAVGSGVAPWWFVLAMVPVLSLRARQLVTGLGRGNALLARVQGIHTHRAGVATLVVVNLVHPIAT